ncbi:MAG: signal peptidase II [Candidatus Sumerlaeia bacterium]
MSPVARFAPIVAALGVLVVDHATKWLAVRYLKGAPPVSIIPGCFHLRYAENTGAAFSMFSGQPLLLTLISTAALGGIVGWFLSTPPSERLVRLCQGLIIGGAAGNLIDRYTRGSVVDFIDWHWKDVYHWPTFNIADSAIFVAVWTLVVYFLFLARRDASHMNEKNGAGPIPTTPSSSGKS